MDAAYKKKIDNLTKKDEDAAALGKTVYNDADDDMNGFLDAEKEENDDMEFGGQS